MATSTIKQPNEIKTATATGTTSAAGSFSISESQRPSDFHAVVAILDNSVAGSSYIVQYNYYTLGVFSYSPPHNPYVGEITITYAYI